MAEHDSAQEKTEQPTPRRIQKAREDGQVPRSRELATAAVLTLAVASMLFVGPKMSRDLQDAAANTITISRSDIFDDRFAAEAFLSSLLDSLAALAPFLLIMLVVAIAAPLALGGWVLSLKPLQLKLERLNPIEGLKRVFGIRGLVEMVKALAKFALLAIAALASIWMFFSQIMVLGLGDSLETAAKSMRLILLTAASLCIALFIIAAIDVPFQLWQHVKKLRMTRQELKEENKESEGDPELRGRIKAIQREMSRRRMMQDVPKADVVLVNPTHFAVALKYDSRSSGAPQVLAKGADLLAFKIRQIAEHHHIHVYREPALTRALYYSTKIGQEIPRTLYIAVAQVLAYVFQTDRANKYGGPQPKRPEDLPVPEELLCARRGHVNG